MIYLKLSSTKNVISQQVVVNHFTFNSQSLSNITCTWTKHLKQVDRAKIICQLTLNNTQYIWHGRSCTKSYSFSNKSDTYMNVAPRLCKNTSTVIPRSVYHLPKEDHHQQTIKRSQLQ